MIIVWALTIMIDRFTLFDPLAKPMPPLQPRARCCADEAIEGCGWVCRRTKSLQSLATGARRAPRPCSNKSRDD